MNPIFAIFKQLGADYTLPHQFVIFFILFILLSTILFSKLRFVIETRENKTTKLDEDANEKLMEANKLAEKYKAEISKVHQGAFDFMKSKKESILETQRQVLKQEEERLQAKIEKDVEIFNQDALGKKSTVLKSSEQLTDDLLEKLV
ncbi:MAG: hypothetical protein A2X86_05010 [Bdellovibrionales bacterium GWA2_49_15]|nr:MAG: hypothetical protein A2X86_05010 [Bdellovibrionales bacterium GWA2_49_15]